MKELHVYRHPLDMNGCSEDVVFYSRRSDGPYYRWLHSECEPERWSSLRVSLSWLNRKMLSAVTWNTVPSTLRARLREHYLE